MCALEALAAELRMVKQRLESVVDHRVRRDTPGTPENLAYNLEIAARLEQELELSHTEHPVPPPPGA